MKVEPISNGNLRIWLSAQEMPTENETGEAWIMLRRLLQAVQRSFGRFGKQLVAELIPVADGGVLLVSSRRHTSVGMPVYYMADLNALYQLAEAWIALPTTACSQASMVLYEQADGYALVLYPSPHLTKRETELLHTYASWVGSGAVAAARAAEYGRLLISGDVFAVLTARAPFLPKPPDSAH